MNRPTLFACVAALLVLCASPARAGSVIYEFFPSTPSPVVAALDFPSPPASATHGWNGTFTLGDGVILHFGLGGEGEVLGFAGSSGGPILDAGSVKSLPSSNTSIGATFSPDRGQSTLFGSSPDPDLNFTYFGDWAISASAVPEPSSLLTLALGIGGVSLAWVARLAKEHPLT